MVKVQSRHALLVLVVLFAVSALVMVVRSNNRQEQKQESARQFRTEQPTALVQMNERQRMESAGYTDESRLKYRGRLTLTARQTNNDVFVSVEDSFTVLPIVPEVPANKLLRESALAIRGQIENKQSFLTQDEAAIFTEYQVRVSEVFKSENLINPGDTVFITRPGGSVSYEGHIIKEVHSRYKPLEAGMDCLFFLKKGDAPGTYWLHQAVSIEGEEITEHVKSPSSLSSKTLNEALAEVRAAARGGNK